jgi:hypothetical protein
LKIGDWKLVEGGAFGHFPISIFQFSISNEPGRQGDVAEPALLRYPAIDPAAFARKVAAFTLA